MTTKPFDPSKPAQTRDGRPVRILCTDAKGDYPICGLVVGNSCDTHTRWGSNGRINDKWDHSWDLINVPTKRKGWIGIVRGATGSVLHTTDLYFDLSNLHAHFGDTSDAWRVIEIEFDE